MRERPGERVVEQRIRNRVLEYFDLAASFERQREYEQAAPIAHVPYEVINQWGDNFPRGLQRDLERSSVYSADEIAALRHFEKVLGSTCRAVPDDYPTLAEVQALPAWEELRQAAESAHNVFARRGKMPEDEEAP